MGLLAVLPHERRRVALLFLHYVWIVAVTIAGKSVRDVYFLSRYNKSVLPLMAVAAAIAVAGSVVLFAKVERRVRQRILVPLVSVVFAATLAALHFRLEGWTIPVLYVWMEVINVLTVLQFWLLAADLLDARQAKRLVPVIGGGGSLAAILIGPQLKTFAKAFGSDTLLWLVCGLLIGSAAMAMATTRLSRVPAIQKPAASAQSSGKTRKSPYLRMISLIVICAAVVSAIVDYQFKIISSGTLRTETDLVGFFGWFYAATGASTLVLQFIVASRAFQRFGVVLVMAVLPLSLGLGSASILIWPVLWSAVLARFSDQTFRFTLHNGGLELLWLPVPADIRSQVKPFIGGSLKSITEGAVGVMMFLLLRILSTAQFSLIALLFCGAWFASLLRLKRLYVAELQSAIASRRLPPEDLEVSATDALTVRVIDKALLEGDTIQRLFVLGLVANVPLTPWRRTLQELLVVGEPDVKAHILEMAAKDEAIVTNELLAKLAAQQGSEAVEAIRIIGNRNAKELGDVVTRRLNDVQPAIRAAACGTLIKLNGGSMPAMSEALDKMLHGSTPEERVAALEECALLDDGRTKAILGDALIDSSRQVRAKALQTAAAHPSDQHARLIAASIGDPALFVAARDALAALPPTVVLPVLIEEFDNDTAVRVRRAALRAMKICPLPKTYSVLLSKVDSQRPVLANQASESLIVIARQLKSPADSSTNAQSQRSGLLQAICTLANVLNALPDSDNAVLLRDYIQGSIANLLPSIVRLAAIGQPDAPIERCIQILRTRDGARLPFVLELFDTLLTVDERNKITPLIEHAARLSGADANSDNSSSQLLTWLTDSLESEDEWLRAITLDYILSADSPPGVEQIDCSHISISPLMRDLIASRIRANPNLARRLPQSHAVDPGQENSRMLSTLEKTILLKSVPLFKDIPGEELSRVAQIAEEQAFAAQTVICRDGDHADCLYVIVTGSVRIQKRGRELAVLTRAHSLGEMGVIDSSPRSADAIAVQDTVVLRVGQEQFLETMQSNADIMQGVVRMLLGRLRRVDELLADKAEAVAQAG